MTEDGPTHKELDALINQELTENPSPPRTARPAMHRLEIGQPQGLLEHTFAKIKAVGSFVMRQIDLVMEGENPEFWPFRKK